MAPGRRRGGERDLNPRAAFLWFAAGGGLLLALLKLVTSHWFPPVLLSLLLIVAYGFFFLWDRGLSGPRFEHAGDNLYYVGFLYTLISLAVSLYRFTSDGYTEDIVQGFGVALSSTVFGLIGRVYVNQSSADEPASVEAATRQSLVVAHRELRAEMDYAIEDYKRFREDLGELREALGRAKGVTAEETKALADEAAKLEDVRGLALRLDKAAEDVIARIAQRQEELAVGMKDEAMTTLRNIASQQVAMSDGVVEAQRDALNRVGARLNDAASSLDRSAASMSRTIETKEQEIVVQAKALRSAVDLALESFGTADFEREVATRVLDPAETRLRRLIEGYQPLAKSLVRTQDGQERVVAESRRVLEQLSKVFAQHEDLAGHYQGAADSLVRAASILESVPEQLERQSARSEAVAREAAVVGERLRESTGALERASASLTAASRSASRPKRGIFASFRRT
ncbi:MAG: hypothetical protein F4112_02995 [Holophagales bacterium]|nr:hypothetical protein [Holophagales bacterium]MYD21882.1 hypothetical protein [Holophagales bacterium]MYI31921.1 hypothetical protein [Holophagales bacterium]